MTWHDGNYYKGDWYQGMQHGIGELRFADGTLLKGRFEKNVYMGPIEEEKELRYQDEDNGEVREDKIKRDEKSKLQPAQTSLQTQDQVVVPLVMAPPFYRKSQMRVNQTTEHYTKSSHSFGGGNRGLIEDNQGLNEDMKVEDSVLSMKVAMPFYSKDQRLLEKYE